MTAHKCMDTRSIFSHLIARARPIFGADADAQGGSKQGANGTADAPQPKRPSAATKRKTALTRVISKNNRKRRLNGGAA